MSAKLIDYAVYFSLLCLALAVVCAAVRLLAGPRAKDRILAFDAMYVNGMLIMLVLAIRSGIAVYFDVALLFALFGFVSTAAMAKFLLRGEVIEP